MNKDNESKNGHDHSSGPKWGYPPYYQQQNIPDQLAKTDGSSSSKCFWKILLAVLLTATITMTLSLGGSFLFFSSREAKAIDAKQTEANPGIVLETKEDDSAGKDEAPLVDTNKSEPVQTESFGLIFDRTEENTDALEKLVQIWELLKDNYYIEYSDAELINMMSEGLIQNMGNRYTFYLSPEERQLDKEGMSGEYSGIGAVVQMLEDGSYIITRLVDGAPAMEAGLLPGDVFSLIDGKEAKEFKSVDSLANAVRGKEGTKVEIEIYRPSTDETLTFSVERKQITNANLSFKMLADNIGYIYVTEFTGHLAENFEQTLKILLDQGMTGLVIDLRNNGGGLADECIKMLDLILDANVVSVIKARMGGEAVEEKWVTKDGVLLPQDMPISIILNEYSASASELFAGALQDLGRAKIVGVQSFGKGVGTRTWELQDGSAVQITNFEYFLPKGENIQDKGIVPDFVVELPSGLENKPITQLELEEDTQLAKAIELVR